MVRHARACCNNCISISKSRQDAAMYVAAETRFQSPSYLSLGDGDGEAHAGMLQVLHQHIKAQARCCSVCSS
jgi:late competence protein required for DNA uptake (superfamily II DNA/RNA helicase)